MSNEDRQKVWEERVAQWRAANVRMRYLITLSWRKTSMNLQSAIKAIKATHQSSARIEAAILGMLAAAESSVGTTMFFEDTRAVLNELALAKTSLDIAAGHTSEVTSTTAFLLRRAQEFVDAETIPPTEWPTPTELLHAVQAASNELSNDRPSP